MDIEQIITLLCILSFIYVWGSRPKIKNFDPLDRSAQNYFIYVNFWGYRFPSYANLEEYIYKYIYNLIKNIIIAIFGIFGYYIDPQLVDLFIDFSQDPEEVKEQINKVIQYLRNLNENDKNYINEKLKELKIFSQKEKEVTENNLKIFKNLKPFDLNIFYQKELDEINFELKVYYQNYQKELDKINQEREKLGLPKFTNTFIKKRERDIYP